MIGTRIAGAAGASGIMAAFTVLYRLLTDPTVLLDLFNAITSHTNPENVIGRLAAAIIGLVLSGLVTLVAAFLHPSPLQSPLQKG